ncbi:MAG: 3'-5' exonuclease domain-containing protein 2 [Bacteroidaceae bacterium]|nr:3'-5' exonuclease domain-containing protein 2 [Bacteroidaceae bacterium]
MKTIFEKFDKNKIKELPRTLFDGRIFTISTINEAQRAVEYLLKQPILGFDTETRPSFKRGVVNKVALLQVSSKDTCFLFRLNRLGLPDCLIQLLEDQKITKIGLSLKDDFRLLQLRKEFQIGTFIDLQEEAKEIGVADCSLQKLYANILGGMICKRQQLTNWEADILTDAQKLYAATDAWACVMIHEEIKRLLQTKDFVLIKSPEETKPVENND